MNWQPRETSTHQDHVIAHVVDATVRGYFLFDETAYLLLDIGFIWNIYLDGEMGLLPHPVAINELSIGSDFKSELKADVDLLLTDRVGEPTQMLRANSSPIQRVEFLMCEALRRLELTCEHDTLIVETSLDTREVKIMSSEVDHLSEVASEEEEFVRERLSQELGRAPTQEEVDAWLREHTESY